MWIQIILAVAVSNLAGASIADHDCAQKWKFIDSARRIIALEFDSIKQINESESAEATSVKQCSIP